MSESCAFKARNQSQSDGVWVTVSDPPKALFELVSDDDSMSGQ